MITLMIVQSNDNVSNIIVFLYPVDKYIIAFMIISL